MSFNKEKLIAKALDKAFPEDVKNPFVGNMYDIFKAGFLAGEKAVKTKQNKKLVKQKIS